MQETHHGPPCMEVTTETHLGVDSPPKLGFTPRQTWAWQLLEDQTSTCRSLAPAHAGHCPYAGTGEGPCGGTRPKELIATALISHKQPPRLQRPITNTAESNTISIVSILTTENTFIATCTRPQEHPQDQAQLQRPPHTSSSPSWVWSQRSRSTLLHFILFLSPWSFGNWNLLWCQKVADNIKCIPLSWCCTLLNLQQHKYHKNYKNCKLTTDFLVQWHK